MLKTEGYENSELFMSLTPKNGFKGSKLYSYKPTNGNGDFVWSRNSTAYRMNQEGVLELMGTNVPRVDYTNTCPELLIEKQSINIALQSETFDNATWAKTNVVVTADSGNAPTGFALADRLVGTGASAIEQTITTIADTYTVSCWVKRNTGTNQTFRLKFNSGFSGNLTATDTWQRFTYTTTSTAASNLWGIASDSSNNNYDILAWGFQVELSDYATSYIPTNTVSITRLKDVCYNTANGYNDADWSVVMRVRLNNIGSSADEPLLALSDGTTDYYFAIYTDSNPKLHFTWYNNPDQDTYSTSDLSNGIVNVGVSFDSVTGEYIIVIDGTLFDSGTLIVNPSGLFGNFNRLDLGSIVGTGGPDRDGIIGIQYFNTALIQSDLENLTT